MSDQIEALIKEISVTHGIAVGRNDPLFMLQTMNARLMDDNAKAQQAMLHQYKEELEGIALRWGNDAKEKSERILNASLTASKEVMANLLQESAKNTALTIKKEVDDSLSRAGMALGRAGMALGRAEKVAMMNLCASAITFLAACMVIIGIIFH